MFKYIIVAGFMSVSIPVLAQSQSSCVDSRGNHIDQEFCNSKKENNQVIDPYSRKVLNNQQTERDIAECLGWKECVEGVKKQNDLLNDEYKECDVNEEVSINTYDKVLICRQNHLDVWKQYMEIENKLYHLPPRNSYTESEQHKKSNRENLLTISQLENAIKVTRKWRVGLDEEVKHNLYLSCVNAVKENKQVIRDAYAAIKEEKEKARIAGYVNKVFLYQMEEVIVNSREVLKNKCQ